MNIGRKNLMFAVIPVACLSLLNDSVNAGMSVAEGETDQPEKTAVGVEHADQQSHRENKNIIDRVFSPLDNAVSDINRDLNEEDDGSGN